MNVKICDVCGVNRAEAVRSMNVIGKAGEFTAFVGVLLPLPFGAGIATKREPADLCPACADKILKQLVAITGRKEP